MNDAIRVGSIVGGKYRVDRLLAEGGMGVVVEATHVALDERVAIKLLTGEALADRDAITRFQREARAAAKIKSDHVVRVFDVGESEDGLPYMAMELLQGTDLDAMIAQGGPLPPELAVRYVLQACEAIDEAHALGIIHRDLKPANLFVTSRQDGTPVVKVLDFGISKRLLETTSSGRDLGLTSADCTLGTPLYMSPEQVRSARSVDTRTDVWALGVVLYELISGRLPFEGETAGEVFAEIVAQPPKPLEERIPGIDPALAAVVSACLVKKVDERMASVAALAEALRPFAPRESLAFLDRVARPRAASTPRAVLRPAETLKGWNTRSTLAVTAPAPRRTRLVAGALALAVGAAAAFALAVTGESAKRGAQATHAGSATSSVVLQGATASKEPPGAVRESEAVDVAREPARAVVLAMSAAPLIAPSDKTGSAGPSAPGVAAPRARPLGASVGSTTSPADPAAPPRRKLRDPLGDRK